MNVFKKFIWASTLTTLLTTTVLSPSAMVLPEKNVADYKCTQGKVISEKCKKGILKKVSENQILVGQKVRITNGNKKSRIDNDTVMFNLTSETVIVDNNGNTLSLEALAIGLKVAVLYDGTLTRSIPPIGTAKKIIVTTNEKNVVKTGLVEKLSSNQIELKPNIYTTMSQNSESIMPYNMKFNITNNTILVDSKGNKIEVSDIQVGAKVSVTYNGILTRSIPPIGTAQKIVLQFVRCGTRK